MLNVKGSLRLNVTPHFKKCYLHATPHTNMPVYKNQPLCTKLFKVCLLFPLNSLKAHLECHNILLKV